MTVVDFFQENFTVLPELSEDVTDLSCRECSMLRVIPKLPEGLLFLDITHCPLKSLPELPESLIKLSCSFVRIF